MSLCHFLCLRIFYSIFLSVQINTPSKHRRELRGVSVFYAHYSVVLRGALTTVEIHNVASSRESSLAMFTGLCRHLREL